MKLECQTLHREVTDIECAKAQRQLPRHFCEGCEWLHVSEDKQGKAGYAPFTYTIRLSNKLRALLIKEAKKQNIQPREYIVRFLSKKLLK